MDPFTMMLLLGGLGTGANMLGQMGETGPIGFRPLPYDTEKGVLNPMTMENLKRGLDPNPTKGEAGAHQSLQEQVRQNYKSSLMNTGSNMAGRGVFDSGWMGQKKAGLLGDRAANEASATGQLWQGIANRRKTSADLAQQFLAQARAGSGTYSQKVTDWDEILKRAGMQVGGQRFII